MSEIYKFCKLYYIGPRAIISSQLFLVRPNNM